MTEYVRLPTCCHEKEYGCQKLSNLSGVKKKYVTQIQYNVKLIHDSSTYMTASYPSSDCQNGVSSARFFPWQTPCQHFDQAQAEESRQQQKRSEDAEVQVLNFRCFTCRFFMFLLHSEDGSLMISGKWLVLSDQHVLRIPERNSGKNPPENQKKHVVKDSTGESFSRVP